MSISLVAASSQALNQGVNLPYLNGATAVTVMLWMMPRSFPVSAGMCALAIGPPPGTSATSRLSLELGGTAGQYVLVVRNADGDSGSTLTTGTILTAGLWHHLAGTYDCVTKSMKLYMNGALQTSGVASAATGSAIASTNCKNGSIGAQDDLSANFFNGNIEDVRIYVRVMSPDEILTIYSSQGNDGIVQDLQARYLCLEGAEGTAVAGVPSIAEFSRRVATPSGSPLYGPTITRARTRRPFQIPGYQA